MFLLLAASFAFAQDSTQQYDLFVGGADVGDRTVSVRYLQRDDGERRVLSVVTEMDAPIGKLSARQSGASSPRGANFTTSIRLGEVLSEVQGIQLPNGGWRVLTASGDGVTEGTLAAREVLLTTLDLYDPGRVRLIELGGEVGVLVAETGTLIRGTLGAGEPTTVKVAGASLPGTRYRLDGDSGRIEVVLDANGVLLRSEMTVFGQSIVSSARSAPQPRSYGTIEVVESPGEGVREADL